MDTIETLHYYRTLSRIKLDMGSKLRSELGDQCGNCSVIMKCWNGDFKEAVLDKDGQCLGYENGNVVGK